MVFRTYAKPIQLDNINLQKLDKFLLKTESHFDNVFKILQMLIQLKLSKYLIRSLKSAKIYCCLEWNVCCIIISGVYLLKMSRTVIFVLINEELK